MLCIVDLLVECPDPGDTKTYQILLPISRALRRGQELAEGRRRGRRPEAGRERLHRQLPGLHAGDALLPRVRDEQPELLVVPQGLHFDRSVGPSWLIAPRHSEGGPVSHVSLL